jgi:ABC-type glycerol-3-phosphate transport system substrate-binding protein
MLGIMHSINFRHAKTLIAVMVAAGVLAYIAGCRRPAGNDGTIVRVWCHQGQEAENHAMIAIANEFNAAHADRAVRVELTFFPDFQYTEKIAIAAAAKDLPDAFDLDGPLVARYVDAELLMPLNAWFTAAELEDFVPTILQQGTISNQLYALGAFESAVVLYFDRDLFQTAGVEPPPADSGWTWEEFLSACARLKGNGIQPLALHMDESADEWFTYAFSPLIWSGGGKLISADRNMVRGVLASPENVRSLTAWQQLFEQGYAPTDPVDPNPFGNDKVAMDWTGHWMARSHVERKGARLGVMPLPRIGSQSVAPSGSWCWGVSRQTQNPDAAALWIKWVTDSDHGIAPIVRANGAVPARRSAFALFPEYAQPPYELFRNQLEHTARPRPRTPYYATLTQRFSAALRDIARGADVATRLQMAEREIQRVIDRRSETMDTAP